MKLIENLYRGDIVELEFVVKTELDGLETELLVLTQHDANGVRMFKIKEHGSGELLYKEEYWHVEVNKIQDFDKLDGILDIAFKEL